MAVDTKPNLSSDKFEQYSGETLNLSGCTCIFGRFIISNAGSFCMSGNAGVGKVITSDTNGLGTWQTISASETITKTISQSSHGFTVGDVVGWSGGTYNKAIANGSYDGEVLGIVSCCINANTFSLTQAGYISGLTGLVSNCTYFLSDGTAGLMTTTEPTADSHISKSVLIANSSTSGWVLHYAGYVISTGSTVISTAQNGLTDSSGIVLLGGKLTQNTVINGDNLYDLSLCNLDTFNLGFSGATITDKDATPSGLQYAADYSANYTNRSLVDKEYIDTHAITGGTCGVCKSGSNLVIGGYLTTSGFRSLGVCGTGFFDLCGEGDYGPHFFTTINSQNFVGGNGSNCGYQIDLVSSGLTVGAYVCASKFIVGTYCSSIFNGIQYGADFSANYTNRSLVDKEYVDTHAASGGAICSYVITGNSTNTGFTVTHNKNTYSVMVEMMENTSPYRTVYTDISRPTTDTVCITFDTAPASGCQYKILING